VNKYLWEMLLLARRNYRVNSMGGNTEPCPFCRADIEARSFEDRFNPWPKLKFAAPCEKCPLKNVIPNICIENCVTEGKTYMEKIFTKGE